MSSSRRQVSLNKKKVLKIAIVFVIVLALLLILMQVLKKKDELGEMTEVTTGLSDGQNVQIIEGLESGQEYYYRYADTISYSFVK